MTQKTSNLPHTIHPQRGAGHEGGSTVKTPIILVGLTLLTILAYAEIWRNGFVSYDDPRYVSENPAVLGGLTASAWKYAWTTFDTVNWIPLTWLSLQFDASLHGPNPRGYHATNLLLHLANGCLLFAALGRMTGCTHRSAIVASLFLLHPMHVESVAWASERKDVLSTFWLLLTIIAYQRYVRRPAGHRYLTVCLLFSLGLMSKSMVVTAPVLLLLIDVWPLGRTRLIPQAVDRQHNLKSWTRLFLEKLPLFLLALLDGLITIKAQSSAQAIADIRDLPLTVRLGTACQSLSWYLGKTLWPTELIPFYQSEPTMNWLSIAGSVALLLCLSLFASVGPNRGPRFFGWWWLLISILPVIGLIQVGSQAHADRYTYIPHIGLFTALTWEIAERLPKERSQRWLPICLLTVVLASSSWLSFHQVSYWRSNETLWQRTLKVDPDNSMAHIQLGNDERRSGNREGARLHYTSALKRWPESHQVHNYLSAIAAAEGKIGEAERLSRIALQYHPASDVAAMNLGLLLMHQQRWPEAEQVLLKLVKHQPQHWQARQQLGMLYEQAGDFSQAWDQFAKVLTASPHHLDALSHGVYVLGNLQRFPEAQELASRLLADQPGNIAVLENSAILAEQSGDRQTAERRYRSILRIQPNHVSAGKRLRALQSAEP